MSIYCLCIGLLAGNETEESAGPPPPVNTIAHTIVGKSSSGDPVALTVEQRDDGSTHIHLNNHDTDLDLPQLNKVDKIKLLEPAEAGVNHTDSDAGDGGDGGDPLTLWLSGNGTLDNLRVSEGHEGQEIVQLDLQLPGARSPGLNQSGPSLVEGSLHVANLEIYKHESDGRFEVKVLEHPLKIPETPPPVKVNETTVIAQVQSTSNNSTIRQVSRAHPDPLPAGA